jgi:glutamate/aspartate transport system substrate-binding protein
MFRKNESELAAMAQLPTGAKLNVPISLQLEESFKVLDDSQGAN